MTRNSSFRYGIGIDTGGTFTDAVLMDLDTREVLNVSKHPTTHHDLGLAMGRALGDVLGQSGVDPSMIEIMAVSSTLATNSVVEGKGDKVGLILIGYSKSVRVPAAETVDVKGGHHYDGREFDPLDLPALLQGVDNMKDKVESYAVTSAMSFRNPDHELVAAKAVSLVDPKPVFCSHIASAQPGVEERSATAVINARLMPVMRAFLDQAEASFKQLGLDADIVVVRGDTGTMPMHEAVRNASTTVASGPAASTVYGAAMAPGESCVVVDVGGTTTDVTMIMDGAPSIDDTGSLIGDYQTHVKSVRMRTVGVGGDSHARYMYDKLKLGPSRVLPLCRAGDLPDPGKWLGQGDESRLIMAAPDLEPEVLESDDVLSCLAASGPGTIKELARETELAPMVLKDRLAKLDRKSLVVQTGFTPTDALNVLGENKVGDAEASMRGARAMAALAGLAAEELARGVLDMAGEKIENAIVTQTLRQETGHAFSGLVDSRRDLKLVDVGFSLNLPLVGLGAASKRLLAPVAKRLKTDIVFPQHYEVGNAVGAILLALDNKESKK